MTSDRPSSPERRHATGGRTGYELVGRLTGAPDGDASRFWDLWSGADGPDKATRQTVLTALRGADEGERATASLVTLAVQHLLLRIGRTDFDPQCLAHLLSTATPDDLSTWSADLDSLLAHIAQEQPDG